MLTVDELRAAIRKRDDHAWWPSLSSRVEARQHLGAPMRRGILGALRAAGPVAWVIDPLVRLGLFDEAWEVQQNELWWCWPAGNLLLDYLRWVLVARRTDSTLADGLECVAERIGYARFEAGERDHDDELLRFLISVVEDPVHPARREAIAALGEAGQRDERAREPLLALVQSRGDPQRDDALGALEPSAFVSEIYCAIRDIADDPDDPLCQVATRALDDAEAEMDPEWLGILRGERPHTEIDSEWLAFDDPAVGEANDAG